MNNIKFEKGQYGIKAIIKSEWRDNFVDKLLKKNIKELELNTGKDWKGTNLDFLKFLSGLECFTIIDQSIKDISGINYLKNLKSLNITTYAKSLIKFNEFNNLTNLSFDWINGAESLFDCEKLIHLGISNYKESDSKSFSKLTNLEKLTITDSNMNNLEGVFSISNLKYLSISYLKNLEEINNIRKLKNLKFLEIQKCKRINDVRSVFECSYLSTLMLLDLGQIDSLKGIKHLSELEMFMFYESTNVKDGNLSELLELKKLKQISFQNRRHYSHKRENFDF